MPSCAACDKSIIAPAPVATYENRTYHPECLTCSSCKRSVSGKQFLKEKNGDILCEDCNERISPKCTRCHKTFAAGISYKKLTDTVFYHNECFKCCGPCRKPIAADFYDMEGGNYICVECFDTYGEDYEKYMNAPPPPPTSAPPEPTNYKDNRNVNDDINKFVSKFDAGLNLNASKPKPQQEQTASLNVDILPAKERTPVNQTSQSAQPAKPASEDNKCAKCNNVLEGTYTVYNDKKYHTKCFVCCQCNQEFKEKTFFKLNGNPLCRNCHSINLVNNASKCKKCTQPILDTVVTFKNGEYHDYCLVCNLCSNKLIGQSIYTDKQDKPYCVGCFTKKEAKRCAKCSQPIAPSQTNLVFEEKNYHKECFVCKTCSRLISSSESFYKSDDGTDGIICAECINK